MKFIVGRFLMIPLLGLLIFAYGDPAADNKKEDDSNTPEYGKKQGNKNPEKPDERSSTRNLQLLN